MKTLVLTALLIFSSSYLFAEESVYWKGERTNQTGAQKQYSAALHSSFADIKTKYEEGGEFFFSDNLNSFGEREVLDPSQELIICTDTDVTFSEMYMDTAKANSKGGYDNDYAGIGDVVVSSENAVKFDSASMGIPPSAFVQSVKGALVRNVGSKGRFCYDLNDKSNTVNYRNAGAEKAVYCDPKIQNEIVFSDSVSGFNCAVKLDIPLKSGELRFLRQLQTGYSTIAQGFVGCFNNPQTGVPELSLIDNPDNCSARNRQACTRSCDWANNVVCDPRDMPSWGNGKCKGEGTLIFRDDVITVKSSAVLSMFDQESGKSYSGEAVMACTMVGDKAAWVNTSSTCNLQ